MEFIRRNLANGKGGSSNIINIGGGGATNNWFYLDEEGNVHTTYNLVSDLEITAFGANSEAGAAPHIEVYDGLNSDDPLMALSAKLGKILNEKIEKLGEGGSKLPNESVVSGITLAQINNWNAAADAKHTHSNKTLLDSITSTKITNWDSTYDILTDYFYKDDLGNLHTKYNFVGDKEVSAFGSSDGGDSLISLDVVDNLTSTSKTAALSANQGRILKGLIDNCSGGGTSFDNADVLSGITSTNITNWNTAFNNNHSHSNKTALDNLTQSVIDNSHTHSNKTQLDKVTSTKITNWDNAATNSHTHSNSTVLDGITSTKVTNWDSAATNSHTHSNKSVIDGITSTKVSNWDSAATNSHTHSNKTALDKVTTTKVSNWDDTHTKLNDYFYLGDDGNLHTKYNFVGDLEVSAYGASGGGSTASIDIVDNLTSTSTTAALSANQGRILKNLIDSKGSGGSDLSNADVLSGITSTKISNWDTAFTNNHTHSNKTQLDKVTSTKISNWDTAYGWGNHASAGYLTSHLDISGKLDKNTAITGATKCKITYDSKGLVTAGADLAASDIPNLNWSKITAGKPTTLSGYGITDAKIANGVITLGSNTITPLTSHQDISGKENTSNKVSAWSTTTNNTRYPSEKLVKDSLDGKISTSHAANNVTSAKITNWDTAYTNNHTHSNKTVLDGISSTNVTNWGTAYTNSHTHSNKTVLDGITSTNVTNWGTAYTNNHTHSNKTTIDGITSTKVSHWDTAYTNNHTHSNKSVIDSLTLDLINMLVNLCKYVSFDASGNVTFTGNVNSKKEITAYV